MALRCPPPKLSTTLCHAKHPGPSSYNIVARAGTSPQSTHDRTSGAETPEQRGRRSCGGSGTAAKAETSADVLSGEATSSVPAYAFLRYDGLF